MQERGKSKRSVRTASGARNQRTRKPSSEGERDQTMVPGNEDISSPSRSRTAPRKRASKVKSLAKTIEQPSGESGGNGSTNTMAEIVKNEPTAQTIKPVKPLSLPPEERSSLIHEMMQSFCDDLEYSITKEHTDPATALENLRSMDATVRFGELTQTPLRDVSWRHLRALEMDDPKLMEQYWIEMKNVARDQIRSGHFAARGAGVANQHPWERATFLALREELSEEWKPRDSIEQTLIDQMAQAYYQYILWSERAALWGVLQPKRKDLREQSARLPQLTEAQAMEQDSNMAERYHRMFLRCQRALRDSRRYSVNIQGAKQVNIGDQQINVTQETDEKQ